MVSGPEQIFRTGLLDGISASLPVIEQACCISHEAVAAGFEWESIEDVWKQVEEEIVEFKEAFASGNETQAELEFGDVLFALINVARKADINAEAALLASCNKFRKRWAYMERAAREQGLVLAGLPASILQALWDEAKAQEY